MPAHYTALPSVRSDDDEMEAAFESDGDDELRDTLPLVRQPNSSPSTTATATIPGAYDFEQVYVYDYPPPGSPPRPSSLALPSAIGNSNGLLPSGPVARPSSRAGFIRRGLFALFPSKYAHVSTSGDRPVGAGMDNDGVFANVVAKPAPGSAHVEQGDDGIYVVPEETQKEAPPSYAVAQADAVPPYWETTVHAPSVYSPGEMLVDGLATGTLFSFCWNMLISLSFSFVGFLLTYLLHTSHAAKFGSRAGLGFTLIQYGFKFRLPSNMPPEAEDAGWPYASGSEESATAATPTPSYDFSSLNVTDTVTDAGSYETVLPFTQEWVAFCFMTFGWFLLLTSFLGYWRVKRWERQIQRSATPPPPEAMERDRVVRQNLERIFGMSAVLSEQEWDIERGDRDPLPEAQLSAEERQLRDNLRAAGLL